MTSASQNPKPSKGETRPWVLERMVHRAQPHLSETDGRSFSPALILGSVIVLMLIVCVALYFVLEHTLSGGTVVSTPDAPGVLFAPTPTGSRPAAATSSPATGSPATQTRLVVATAVPSPTPPSAAPLASPTRIRYKVQPGDTLSTIAEKYDVSVASIMRANNMKTDVIRIGDELIIPAPTPTPGH